MSSVSAKTRRKRSIRKGSDPRYAEIARFKQDPLGYVAFAFLWGQGELCHDLGPEKWQRDVLEDLGRQVRERNFDGHTPCKPVRIAIASGHGIGKSALTCWIILWLMSTRMKCNITVTANSLPQLQAKTWSQLSKWLRLCINGDWFMYSSARGNLCLRLKGDEDETFCVGQTCKEENSEAFQGQHAPTSSSVYIIDEASAVPDKIWEAAEGGMTDGEPMMIVFGNPTRNVGAFAEIWGRMRKRWPSARQIDARDVPRGNKDLFQEWIDDYGEDSDFVRIRVKGQFPRSGSSQFISTELVRNAMELKLDPQVYAHAPRVLGVDVAREGDDMSVIVKRQGLHIHDIKKFRLDDLMVLADLVVDSIHEYDPHATFIDANGMGAGVQNRLGQLGFDVIPVKGSERATKPGYFNMRSQMWGSLRDHLKAGGDLPNDQELEAELTAQEYGLSSNELIQLVGKKEMKTLSDFKRSPDIGDGIAYTFASEVSVEDTLESFVRLLRDQKEDDGWEDFLKAADRWDPMRRP